MKTFPTEIRNEFYRENFFAVDIVFLGLPDNTGTVTNDSCLRLCNGGIDIVVNDIHGTPFTYTAQGDFIGFSTITEEFDVKVGKFQIHLSGLASGMVNKFIDKDFEGKQVQIAKCFLDYTSLDIINKPYIIFEGIIYNVSISENAVTCNITIECSTLWADFDRKNGRMTNNQSNWFYQKGLNIDKCFTKAGTVGQIEYKWGRA